MRKRGERDYLYQRPGSVNWWLRLPGPDGKRVAGSLGTPDRRKAEILALPLIAAHKQTLLTGRLRMGLKMVRRYDPGTYDMPAPPSAEFPELADLPAWDAFRNNDAARFLATEATLIFLDANGVPTGRQEPNLIEAAYPIEHGPVSERTLVRAYREAKTPPIAKREPNADDALIETHIAHVGLRGYPAKEARDMWELYKQLSDNKPLREATRDDGRKLVAHFADKKRATIVRKLVPLVAAVNLAIDERKLPADHVNPFSNVLPKATKEQKEAAKNDERIPFSDDDMAVLFANLKNLSKSDQTLFRILAATGMRREEPFQIDGEASEGKIRYVRVGTKSEASDRRVPLPTSLLPYLPKVIKGKLFTGNVEQAGKRLNKFIRACGFTDKRYVLHCLRHRAATKLSVAECPDGILWALGGWSSGRKQNASRGYIHYPMATLRKWIERIDT
jgi:integrase